MVSKISGEGGEASMAARNGALCWRWLVLELDAVLWLMAVAVGIIVRYQFWAGRAFSQSTLEPV